MGKAQGGLGKTKVRLVEVGEGRVRLGRLE